VNTQTTATVVATAPLMIVVDGATVSCPANVLRNDDGTLPTFTVDQRVTVTVRNPELPLVQGEETAGGTV
jgi:hypothetical protein